MAREQTLYGWLIVGIKQILRRPVVMLMVYYIPSRFEVVLDVEGIEVGVVVAAGELEGVIFTILIPLTMCREG